MNGITMNQKKERASQFNYYGESIDYLDNPYEYDWKSPLPEHFTKGDVFTVSDFLSAEECSIITSEVLDEKKVERKEFDLDGVTHKNAIFSNPVIKDIMHPKLKLLFGRNAYVQAWANTFYKGDGVKEHNHRDPNRREHKHYKEWVCCVLFLSGPTDVGTWFARKKKENAIGDLLVFPSNIAHFAPKNPYDEVRVTMGIDVRTSKDNSTWFKLI